MSQSNANSDELAIRDLVNGYIRSSFCWLEADDDASRLFRTQQVSGLQVRARGGDLPQPISMVLRRTVEGATTVVALEGAPPELAKRVRGLAFGKYAPVYPRSWTFPLPGAAQGHIVRQIASDQIEHEEADCFALSASGGTGEEMQLGPSSPSWDRFAKSDAFIGYYSPADLALRQLVLEFWFTGTVAAVVVELFCNNEIVAASPIVLRNVPPSISKVASVKFDLSGISDGEFSIRVRHATWADWNTGLISAWLPASEISGEHAASNVATNPRVPCFRFGADRGFVPSQAAGDWFLRIGSSIH